MNGNQPMSGWQGMQPQLQPGDPTQAIMNGSGTGQYQVSQTPGISDIQPGGSPNLGAMSSLAMLAMLA